MSSTEGDPPAELLAVWPPEATEIAPASRWRLRIALAVAALGLGAVAVLGGSDAASEEFAVGDCLDVLEDQGPRTGNLAAAPAEQVGCEEDNAAYRVAIRLDGAPAQCPSPIYTVRTAEGPSGTSTLCLTYNVGEGDCFIESPAEAGPFDCGLGPRDGAIKILRVVAGVEDPARCEDLDEPGLLIVTVPQPATTFCYLEFLPDERSGPVLTA